MALHSKLALLVAFALAGCGATWLGQPAIPSAGGSPPTFVRKVDGVASDNPGSSQTLSSVQVDGSNKLLVVTLVSYHSGGPTISGITFNTSENFTQLTNQTFYDGSNAKLQVWYLINPTTTTANVVISMTTGAQEFAAAALLFNGVNQSTPLGTIAADVHTSAATSSTVSPGSATNDLMLDVLGHTASGTYTPGAGQTEQFLSSFGASYSSVRGSTKAAAAGSTTMSWATPSTRQTLIGVAVKGL